MLASMRGRCSKRACALALLWVAAGCCALLHGALQYTGFGMSPFQPGDLQRNGRQHENTNNHNPTGPTRFGYETSGWRADENKGVEDFLSVGAVGVAAAAFGAVGLGVAAIAVAAKKSDDNRMGYRSESNGNRINYMAQHGPNSQVPPGYIVSDDGSLGRMYEQPAQGGYLGRMYETSFRNVSPNGGGYKGKMSARREPSAAAPLVTSRQSGDTAARNYLEMGQMYHSVDALGNWWPIVVESRNIDGSYICSVVTRSFEAQTIWPNVWPMNCKELYGSREQYTLGWKPNQAGYGSGVPSPSSAVFASGGALQASG